MAMKSRRRSNSAPRLPPKSLPCRKQWKSGSVTYGGEFVVHNGSTWQARKDTAMEPGGFDWLCAARAGKDGRDGESLNFRGVFDTREAYSANDVVAFEGQGLIAVRDHPTGIPGDRDGWQLIAACGVKGERGLPGVRGHRGCKGDRGPSGAKIKECGSSANVSPLFRFTMMEASGRRYACATCSRNSSIRWASRKRVDAPVSADRVFARRQASRLKLRRVASSRISPTDSRR